MLFFCEECGRKNDIKLTPPLVEANKFVCLYCEFTTSFPFLDSDNKTTCSTSRIANITCEPELVHFEIGDDNGKQAQQLLFTLSDIESPQLSVKPFKQFERLITVKQEGDTTFLVTLNLPDDPAKFPGNFNGSGLIFCELTTTSWWTVDLFLDNKLIPEPEVEKTEKVDDFFTPETAPISTRSDVKSGTLEETLLKQLAEKNNELKQFNQSMARVNKELSVTRQIMASQTSGIIFIDGQRHILYANTVFCTMTGHTPQTLRGKTLDQVIMLEAGWKNLQALLSDIRHKKIWHGKVLLKGVESDKAALAMHLTYSPGGANGKEEGFACRFPVENKAIDELTDGDEEHIMTFDALTGLPDRPSFQQHLEDCIVEADKIGHQVGLIYIDLDHFKRINTLFGPGFGDKILCSIVTILERCVKDAGEDFVCRLGGDEFAIVMTQPPNRGLVRKLAEKILDKFQQSVENESRSIYISPSIGISIHPKGGKSPLQLLRNADTAMEKSKKNGGNRSCSWDTKMKIEAVENLYLETDLRKAVARDELMNYYQAQIDLEDGSICGMEALARWEHPQHGVISPGAFIPIAENTGLIEKLGVDLVRQACVQGKVWRDMGFKKFVMAANLSGRLLRRKNLYDEIMECVDSSGFPPSSLELEFTEGVLIENMDDTVKLIERWRSEGITMAIDDFGTGYSSLSYLQKFKVDKIKIDRSFVMNVTTNPTDAAIVMGIIAIAKELKFEVIAEGIETEDQLFFLQKNGCDVGQGFLFSQPIAANDMRGLLLRDSSVALTHKRVVDKFFSIQANDL